MAMPTSAVANAGASFMPSPQCTTTPWVRSSSTCAAPDLINQAAPSRSSTCTPLLSLSEYLLCKPGQWPQQLDLHTITTTNY